MVATDGHIEVQIHKLCRLKMYTLLQNRHNTELSA